jgi:hypothetical protein
LTPFALDNQYSRLTDRMCDMLCPNASEENVPNLHALYVLTMFVAIVHINRTIEHNEYFLTVVYVPFVRLVSPVKSRGDAIHICNRNRFPCISASEVPGRNKVHGDTLERQLSFNFSGARPMAQFCGKNSNIKGRSNGWLKPDAHVNLQA